ncbi:MAG: efflux RND transporter periplasmic adaptor subunit [candidate division KSB1 bacterium]|nr:efflux RND transporter periplasmic adaptor subunit [candidate division KSB1 bacterium]MDZ7319710.1 efflux RND transporter periplasmic adaptor subunit [candidate division KSB1 bacterium]
MKERIIFLIGVLLLMNCGGPETGSDSEIAVPVTVEEITLKPIEEFYTTTGTVNAIKNVTLKSETSGLYRLATNPKTNQPFKLGDMVARGQVIIYLDNPELENNAAIDSKKLNLEISKQEYEKQQSLYDKGGVTLRELKAAEKAYIDAKYAYENVLLQLSKLKITAPFDGIIVDLPYYTPGTKVEANQTMAALMDYRNLYMEISLPEKQLSQIAINSPVRVMNYALAKDTLRGKISQASPALNPDTRSFKALVNIDNANLILRPGMFVKAEIVVARKDSAIVIPKDIILDKRQGKTVYIVEKGAAQERTISTGLENPTEVEVVEGLNKNERLVVKGFETLRNRSKVKIIR